MEIKVGDVVQLNSGSPELTVLRVFRKEDKRKDDYNDYHDVVEHNISCSDIWVEVGWIDGTMFSKEQFPVQCIRKKECNESRTAAERFRLE